MLLLRNHIHCDNYTGYNTIISPYIHHSNHRGTLSHAHDEKWVETYTLKWQYESTKLTVSQSDGDVRVCTFEYYIQTGCIMCIGETEMMVNVAYALHRCLRTLLVTKSSLKSGNYREALNLAINHHFQFSSSLSYHGASGIKWTMGRLAQTLRFWKYTQGFSWNRMTSLLSVHLRYRLYTSN